MRRTGVDHFDLVVSSLDRSLQLYRELLGPLGYTRAGEIVGERSERVVYLSGERRRALQPAGGSDTGRPQSLSRRSPPCRVRGFLTGPVDERVRWAREQGLEIENNPQEYDYRPGYYAGFFYDPDGIKLEIVRTVMEDCSLPQVERDVRGGSTDQISRSSRGTELTHPHPPDGN